jgi:lysophospholipase L1-like esterase
MPTRAYSAASLLAVFLTVSCYSSQNPSGPTPLPQPNSTMFYTAMGASDVNGIGASMPCLDPFGDCPSSTGYVFVARRQLQAKGFTVNFSQLGIPTATIGRDFEDLGNSHNHFVLGNLIENEAPVVHAESTLITIFIGANDVNVITGALGAGDGGSDQIGYINKQVSAFGADYATLLSSLRGRAQSARIVVLNLPNMGALPFLAGASLQQREAAQKISVGMTTTVIDALTAQNVLVIDMMCDPRSYQASTYSSDGFHPSDAGYAWMAGEVVSAATTAYRSPQPSCTQMSLVP